MKTLYRPSIGLFLCLFLGGCSPAALHSDNRPWALLMAGGSISLCSSEHRVGCQDARRSASDWPEEVRLETRFEVDAESLARVIDPTLWAKDREAERLALKEAFSDDLDNDNPESFDRHTLQALLPDTLSGRERARVFDQLEAFQGRKDQPDHRLTEQASPEFTAERSRPDIYAAFVEMAAAVTSKDEARILVFTSAARDPLSPVDYYLSAFEKSGADVRWAPADPAVMESIQSGDCQGLDERRNTINNSWERERVYPDLAAKQQALCQAPDQLLSLVDWADGVFFNGGDQSRHRATLFDVDNQPSPALEKIREKFENDELVVGGTSAGTAVQTGQQVPMISSGSPEAALLGQVKAAPAPAPDCDIHGDCPETTTPDTLTWHPDGGLGFFDHGLLDTHYGERGRPIRSIALAAATGTELAFGVDETTALQVKRDKGGGSRFQVIGEASALIMDFRDAELQQDSDGISAQAITLHRLTAGSDLTLSDRGQWQLESAADKDRQSCEAKESQGPLAYQGLARAAARMQCHGLDTVELTHSIADRQWQFKLKTQSDSHWLASDGEHHPGWHALSLTIEKSPAKDKEAEK